MSTVMSTVVNLQCNYLSQTKHLGAKVVGNYHGGGNSAQEVGNLEWPIPFCPRSFFQNTEFCGILHRYCIHIKSICWKIEWLTDSRV